MRACALSGNGLWYLVKLVIFSKREMDNERRSMANSIQTEPLSHKGVPYVQHIDG